MLELRYIVILAIYFDPLWFLGRTLPFFTSFQAKVLGFKVHLLIYSSLYLSLRDQSKNLISSQAPGPSPASQQMGEPQGSHRGLEKTSSPHSIQADKYSPKNTPQKPTYSMMEDRGIFNPSSKNVTQKTPGRQPLQARSLRLNYCTDSR